MQVFSSNYLNSGAEERAPMLRAMLIEKSLYDVHKHRKIQRSNNTRSTIFIMYIACEVGVSYTAVLAVSGSELAVRKLSVRRVPNLLVVDQKSSHLPCPFAIFGDLSMILIIFTLNLLPEMGPGVSTLSQNQKISENIGNM